MFEINGTQFQDAVIRASAERPVLVDFWAPWCGPCRMLGPVLEKLAQEFSDHLKLVKINSDDNQELAQQYKVRGIPFVLLFRHGEVVDSFVGAKSEGQVRAFLQPHLPKPGDDLIGQAREARAAGELTSAAEAYATALAINPAQDDVRSEYVRTLVDAGRTTDAEIAFEPLRIKASLDFSIAATQQWLDAARALGPDDDERSLRASLERAPQALELKLKLARRLMLSKQWQQAMDELLAIIAQDRRFADDLPRRLMLAIFELCSDASLVGAYRRRLSAGLY